MKDERKYKSVSLKVKTMNSLISLRIENIFMEPKFKYVIEFINFSAPLLS